MEGNRRSPSPKPRSPRTRRSAATKRLEKLNQEQLVEAIKKKKECNAKAQAVVMKLLDPIEDVNELLKMMREINQCHYDDIIQERAIMKLCGYPLCKGEIEELPKQLFHISTITKTVYELADRRNFCSGHCMRSSNYIKVQLLTSPLWMRDNEVIPDFKLLSLK